MDAAKKKALEKAGFSVGTVQDFLGLEDWENRVVELKYQLSRRAKILREGLGLTQQIVARKIGSSQSRVAKIEAGSDDVSLDLLINYFFAVGGQLKELETTRAASKPAGKRYVVGKASVGAQPKKRVAVS